MIIQIIGLPGSGKTTLAKTLMEHTDVSTTKKEEK
jgi:adenylate kinase family enzyme